MNTRGADMEKILKRLTELWADDSNRPHVAPPRLVIGGAVQASTRAAKYGSAGWIGAARHRAFAKRSAGQEAWSAAGRERAGRDGARLLRARR